MINIGFMIGHVDYIPHAKLLIGSIVKNMDTVKSVHIFAMTPRDFPIKIGIYGVTQITFDMPKNMVNIPFADKMFAASKFESLVEAPYLWMDVDGYFFKEPNLISDSEISVNPVDQKNIGDLYEGQLSEFWDILYNYFQLDNIHHSSYPVTTGVSNETIFPYFNVGMVLVQKHRNLFKLVTDSLIVLLENDDIKAIIENSYVHLIFIHQAIFTVAVLKLYKSHHIKPLPYGVNYPMHFNDNFTDPIPYEDIVSIRYDTFFEFHEVPSCWQSIFSEFKDSLKINWYYE